MDGRRVTVKDETERRVQIHMLGPWIYVYIYRDVRWVIRELQAAAGI